MRSVLEEYKRCVRPSPVWHKRGGWEEVPQWFKPLKHKRCAPPPLASLAFVPAVTGAGGADCRGDGGAHPSV